MKKKLLTLLALAVVGSTCLLCLWWWQANRADSLKIINVPQWIAGGGNISYSIASGKSQIKPYGTVWKRTTGTNFISNFPVYDDKDLEAYLARRK